MKPESKQWHPLGDAATPAEAEALLAIKALLPDDPVTHAWPNVSFLDLQGRTAEIDLVLLTRVGFFVVELKGWHGVIEGDQQNWRLTHPNGRVDHRRNPLFTTDLKAKRLRSLLEDVQPRAAGKLPFLGALVVLHGRDSQIKLPDTAKAGLLALDGFNVKGLPTFGQFLTTPPQHQLIDPMRAKQVVAAVQRAGFTPTPKQRFVGQYSLEKADPLHSGPTWQDLLAVHPNVPGVQRRVRVFDVPPGSSAEARQQIELAAKREFLFTQGVQHGGIAAPLELITTDSGPALIFAYDPAEVPLDDYLTEHGDSLSLDDRLDLVRQLADVLRYAHQRRLVHRGLTPAQVYVNTSSTPPRVVVRDWQTGRRSAGSTRHSTSAQAPTATSFGTTDVRGLIGQGDWIYLPPETHQGGDDLPPVPLDVYGLGALSYLVLTGQAPAATIVELQSRLDANGCLDPQLAQESLPDEVAELVRHATRRAESERTVSVDEFLSELDGVYEALTAPDDDVTAQERHQAADPLSAVPGDAIADRFIVRERRGSGSTGTALLVDDVDGDRPSVVLKIAKDDNARRRLDDEAEVLAQLDHPRVVKLLEPPLDVDGRRALLLSDAGKQTLAGWLETNGRATIAELERFGGHLMEAVAYLDSKGVFHRDIKPANLGIRPDVSTRRPGLVLFDFSLAQESLTNLGSGTRGYLDPFVALSTSPSARTGGAKVTPRRRFDRAAELYAVAVTLFEMATTQLPFWTDGEPGPQSMHDVPFIEASMFEHVVAAGLVRFFSCALAPDVADRFGDVATMAQAWHAVFAAVDDADHDAGDEATRAAAAAAATLDTPLADAGLSPRALSALSRLQARTVGELLRTPPMATNSVPGLGEQYRKEVQRLARQWRRSLLPTRQTETQPSPTVAGDRSLENSLRRLLPRSTESVEAPTLRALLGFTSHDGAAAEPVQGTARTMPDDGWWPDASALAEAVGTSRSAVTQTMEAAAVRWRRSDVVKEARDELIQVLTSEEGVATLPELATALVLRHGSSAEGSERLRRASGLVRAVIEADARSSEPSFVVRRQTDGPVLIAAIDTVSSEIAEDAGDRRPAAEPASPTDRRASAEGLLEDAEWLGATARRLVSDQGLVSAAAARESIRRERGNLPFSDDRLLRLAAAASGSVALSSFHELHRLDLDPAIATEAALRGVAAPQLTEASVRKRVANRFPALPPLPDRPQLDALVTNAVPMRWEGDRYARPTAATSSAASSTHMTRMAGDPADAVDAQLRASLRHSSALTLCVSPRRHDAAISTLCRLYGVAEFDAATTLLTAIRATAARDGVSWPLVLQSDLEHEGSDWAHLRELVADALAEPWAAAMADERPLLVFNAAPLARYGLTELLSALLDQSQPRPAARWLLVPRRPAQRVPTLDGRPVPLGADRWLDLPQDLGTLDRLRRDADSSSRSADPSLSDRSSGVLA